MGQKVIFKYTCTCGHKGQFENDEQTVEKNENGLFWVDCSQCSKAILITEIKLDRENKKVHYKVVIKETVRLDY